MMRSLALALMLACGACTTDEFCRKQLRVMASRADSLRRMQQFGMYDMGCAGALPDTAVVRIMRQLSLPPVTRDSTKTDTTHKGEG